MKKLLKIFLGVAVFVSISLATVFYFTSGVVDVSDKFFKAVKSGNIDEAYTFLSEDFKANTGKNELEHYLLKTGLSDFQESSWANRSIMGGKGELDGTITTKSGNVVPIKMGFVKTGDAWKIYSIRKPSSGIQTVSLKMPSDSEQVKLVDAAMKVFAESVNDKSMKKFYDYISHLWQKQITIEKFDEIFGSFYDAGIDLTVLNNYSPVFEQEATFEKDGVLLLKGHYTINQREVLFEQRYILEGVQWKLIGFHINVE